MPETPDHGRVAGRMLFTASVVCLAGAVLAYATGDPIPTRSGASRSQMDAVWVLGTLAVAFIAGAFILALAQGSED